MAHSQYKNTNNKIQFHDVHIDNTEIRDETGLG